MIKLETPKYKLLAEGEYSGNIIDIDDLGDVKGRYGTQHKVRIIVQVDDPSSESQDNPTVRRDFPLSNTPNADLVKFIEALLGRELAEQERLDFDVESLLGTACKITIVHNTDDQDRTWANIESIKPYPSDLRPMRVTPWVRLKDRTTNGKGKLISRPRTKTAAEILAEEKRVADFINDDDMPPFAPIPAEEPALTAGAGEYNGTDDDVPF